MKILKALLFAITIVLSLGVSGCYMDEVAVASEPVVVYRSGFGYGYWYNSYWYPAPAGYVYAPRVRPYWGPCYHHPIPRPPSPYYHDYHGGYGGGYHGSPYRGGGWHHR